MVGCTPLLLPLLESVATVAGDVVGMFVVGDDASGGLKIRGRFTRSQRALPCLAPEVQVHAFRLLPGGTWGGIFVG